MKDILRLFNINFLYSVFVNGFGSLFGMVNTILITKIFGADILGLVGFGNQLLFFLSAFTAHGCIPLLINASAKFTKERIDTNSLKNIISSHIIYSIIISLIFIFIFYILSLFIEDSSKKLYLMVFMPSLIFFTIKRLMASTFAGMNKIFESVIYDGFLGTFIPFIIIIILFYSIELSITTNEKVIISSVIYLFTNVIIVYLSKVNITRYLDKFNYRFLSGTTLNFERTASEIIFQFRNNSDIIFVGVFFPPKITGIYFVCSKLSKLLELIGSVLIKKFNYLLASNNSKKSFLKTTGSFYKFYLILSIIACVFCYFFSENILMLWGLEFKSYDYILFILFLASIVRLGTAPFAESLNLIKKEKLFFKINLIILALIIISYSLVYTLSIKLIYVAMVTFLINFIFSILVVRFSLQKIIRSHE